MAKLSLRNTGFDGDHNVVQGSFAPALLDHPPPSHAASTRTVINQDVENDVFPSPHYQPHQDRQARRDRLVWSQTKRAQYHHDSNDLEAAVAAPALHSPGQSTIPASEPYDFDPPALPAPAAWLPDECRRSGNAAIITEPPDAHNAPNTAERLRRGPLGTIKGISRPPIDLVRTASQRTTGEKRWWKPRVKPIGRSLCVV